MNNLVYRETPASGVKGKSPSNNERNFEAVPDLLPQMRISFNGDLFSANRSARKLLVQLEIENHRWLAQLLRAENAELLQRGCCTDFEILAGSFLYRFSAVAFDEADYVGLHCYQIEKKNITNIHQ